jgi:hypothetical protein
MSNATILSLNFASQQIVTYAGFLLFAAGIIGNPLTLLIFLSLRTFRESSCAFYLTFMSFVNTFHLFTGLLTYIVINGFGINWLNMSVFYCKFRSAYVPFCVLTSFSCMSLATIDQFLATCSHPRWHQWNNIKLARYILIGTTTVWILFLIPFILYYELILSPTTGKTTCVITNAIFQRYVTYFHTPVLASILPAIMTISFGILAYRNVQLIAYRTVPLVRREFDKQLTVMVLVQVFYDAIAVSPTGILNIFKIIYNTPNNPLITAQLNFCSNTLTILFYFHFVVTINRSLYKLCIFLLL